jgi:hypothetical protein
VASRKRALVLAKLAEDSSNLASMVAELCGEPMTELGRTKPLHWSGRFSASGKVALGKMASPFDVKDPV